MTPIEIGNSKLYHGECLQVMEQLINEGVKVDMILTDPPYGTTACKWDTVIPFEPMWACVNGLIKSNGAIALFGSEPFSSMLRCSNLKMFKYDWVWEKNTSAGFIHAKNQPLKKHENISIFSNGGMGHKSILGNKRMQYNPQGIVYKKTEYKRLNTNCVNVIGNRPSHKLNFHSEYTNYPTSVISFKSDSHQKLHPTQKPVSLLEYLIKTYTNEGDTVLDFTAGSFSTAVACVNTNRKFIGIELDDKYFEIGVKRVTEAVNKKSQPTLFD